MYIIDDYLNLERALAEIPIPTQIIPINTSPVKFLTSFHLMSNFFYGKRPNWTEGFSYCSREDEAEHVVLRYKENIKAKIKLTKTISCINMLLNLISA